MATPILIVQTGSAVIRQNSPGSISLVTQNADGTPLNVSAGYTLEGIDCLPTQNQNGNVANFEAAAQMTATFSATGFILSWTQAQANSLMANLPSTVNTCYVRLSNDANVTNSIAAILQLTLDTVSALG